MLHSLISISAPLALWGLEEDALCFKDKLLYGLDTPKNDLTESKNPSEDFFIDIALSICILGAILAAGAIAGTISAFLAGIDPKFIDPRLFSNFFIFIFVEGLYDSFSWYSMGGGLII